MSALVSIWCLIHPLKCSHVWDVVRTPNTPEQRTRVRQCDATPFTDWNAESGITVSVPQAMVQMQAENIHRIHKHAYRKQPTCCGYRLLRSLPRRSYCMPKYYVPYHTPVHHYSRVQTVNRCPEGFSFGGFNGGPLPAQVASSTIKGVNQSVPAR